MGKGMKLPKRPNMRILSSVGWEYSNPTLLDQSSAGSLDSKCSRAALITRAAALYYSSHRGADYAPGTTRRARGRGTTIH